LATTLAYLGGDYSRGRTYQGMEDLHICIKDSNVKIREDDDQLLWSLNPTGIHVSPCRGREGGAASMVVENHLEIKVPFQKQNIHVADFKQ